MILHSATQDGNHSPFGFVVSMLGASWSIMENMQRPCGFALIHDRTVGVTNLGVMLLWSKQTWGWWFETLSSPSWRHRYESSVAQSCQEPHKVPLWVPATQCHVFKSSHQKYIQYRAPVSKWITWTPDIFSGGHCSETATKYPCLYLFLVEFGGAGDIHKHQNSRILC